MVQVFRIRALWGSAALIGAVAAAYLPALRAGFIWDDDAFLTGNPLIRAPDGLYRFWCTAQASDYWPVTSTTLWFEWRVWGMRAAGYHATNLVLHAGEALLLWAVLARLRLPGAFLAALLFAVHPVNTESVVWIAERKNLMAMLFFLLTFFFFLKDEERRPAPGPARLGPASLAYGLSLLCFALAMLAKGSVAMAPLVLLGLVAWRRRPFLADLLRLAPFFAVTIVLTAVNIWFQHHALYDAVRKATGLERLLGAGAVVWFYLGKVAWPRNLMFIYPQWHIRTADPRWWLPLLAAAALTAVLWRHRRGWARPAMFAWGYFCVMLIPVMGLTDVYFMRYALVADHYVHLAMIGVVGLAAAGWAGWNDRTQSPGGGVGTIPVAVAAAVVAALGVLTWRQCLTYHDPETLYRATLDRNPECWLAHNNLGNLLHGEGRLDEAAAQYEAALRTNPDYPEAHNNLGNILLQTGHPDAATLQFEDTLRLNPRSAEAHNNLGNILLRAGQFAEAANHYAEALRINPAYAAAHNGLGNALLQSGRVAEAIGQYEIALRLDPAHASTHFNFGVALLEANRFAEAIDQFEAVLRANPDDAEARAYLLQAETRQWAEPPDRSHP